MAAPYRAPHRPATAPRHLSDALAAYPVEEICRRLACSEATARLLFRAAPPRSHGWLPGVRGLARALAVEPAALSLLLAEALNDGAAGDEPARAAGGR